VSGGANESPEFVPSLPTGAYVVGVVAGTVPDGTSPEGDVGRVVAGVVLPAPSVRFGSTVLARPGWAEAATAVNPAAAATDAATTVRVTIETRRRPASRARKRPDEDLADADLAFRDAAEPEARGERGDGIEYRIGE